MHILIVHSASVEQNLDWDPLYLGNDIFQKIDACKIFGPYSSQTDASNAGNTLDEKQYNWAVVPLIHLSEALDNPNAHLWWGDSPR